MYKLVIEDDQGQRTEQTVTLEEEILIGRFAENGIMLNERNISRKHARLYKQNDEVLLEDLNSFNGVYINGDRLTGIHPVHEGDRFIFGDFNVEISGEDLPAAVADTTQRNGYEGEEITQPGVQFPNLKEVHEDPIVNEPTSISNRKAPAQIDSDPEPEHEATALIRLDQFEQQQKSQTASIKQSGAYLLCVSTNFAGQEFDIKAPETVIGRIADGNQIVIDHRSVSRHHAKIVVNGNSFQIVDMKSANGTLINDEEYAQTTLRGGDCIELGHVKLRFIPSGYSYTLTPEERDAIKAVDPKNARLSKRAPRFDSIEDEVTFSERQTSSKAATYMIAGFLGAILLVLSLVLILWVMRDDSEPKATIAENKQPRNENLIKPVENAAYNPEASNIYKLAVDAFNQKDWNKAVTLADTALTIDGKIEEAKQLKTKALAEQKAKKSYETALVAFSNQKWPEALAELSRIPEESAINGDVQNLKARVKAGVIDQKVQAANKAIDSDDINDAESIANEIEEIDPMAPQLASLHHKIEKARKKQDAAKRVERTRIAAKTPKRSNPKQPTRPIKQAKAAPKAKAVSNGGMISNDPKTLYKDASKKLLKGDFTSAAKLFSECVKSDRKACYCLRGLGITYAKARRSARAVDYYKRYLKCSPTAPDSAQVKKIIQAYESRN